MSISTLRGLAKAYSDSIIDRKQYIRQRRELIDDIVAGNVAIIPYESESAIEQPVVDRTFSYSEDTLELPMLDEQVPDSTANITNKIVVGLLIVGLAISGWFVFKWSASSNSSPEVAAVLPPQPGAELDTPSRDLLVQFLSVNQWQNERLETLTAKWLAKDSSIRRAAESNSVLHQMTEAIGHKYLEETALLELADRDEVLARQRRLLDLAIALSPQSERVQRLEVEWLAAQLDSREIFASDIVAAESFDSQMELGGTAPIEELTDVTLDPIIEIAGEEPQRDDNLEASAEPASPEGDGAAVTIPSVPDSHSNVETPETLSPTTPDIRDAVEGVAATSVATAVAAVNPIRDSDPTKATPITKSGTKKSGCRAALAKQRRPYCRDALGDKINGPQLAVLPVGTFNMGGKSTEERPQRAITVDRPFAVSVYEISQREFSLYCQAKKLTCPTQPWSDVNLPVVNVTWEMAADYARWLSGKTNATYRLPSESEWEYAARGGTSTPYPFGDETSPTDARFSFRGTKDTPLANNDRSVNRNNFRLYHMVGNVQEWVQDAWFDNYAGAPSDVSARLKDSQEKVVRGGSFRDGPQKIRSASRTYLAAGNANITTGFRIVREVD